MRGIRSGLAYAFFDSNAPDPGVIAARCRCLRRKHESEPGRVSTEHKQRTDERRYADSERNELALSAGDADDGCRTDRGISADARGEPERLDVRPDRRAECRHE